jgi:tetratricopeptide (TPR) repeat protein
VTQAFTSVGDLDYWATVRYAESAGPVAEELATLVRTGRADVAREPLASAVELLLATLDRADDAAGTLDDLLNRLLSSHAEACRQAPGDPVELADWLLSVQFDADRWCPVEISSYAGALGWAGLDRYRAAISRRWAADPGDLSARDAVERLARWERDIPTLIEVIGGDLRHAAQYGRLARALADIGDREAARDWAERGLAAHPDDPPGAGLRAFLSRR